MFLFTNLHLKQVSCTYSVCVAVLVTMRSFSMVIIITVTIDSCRWSYQPSPDNLIYPSHKYLCPVGHFSCLAQGTVNSPLIRSSLYSSHSLLPSFRSLLTPSLSPISSPAHWYICSYTWPASLPVYKWPGWFCWLQHPLHHTALNLSLSLAL